jgi:hypothetical protein
MRARTHARKRSCTPKQNARTPARPRPQQVVVPRTYSDYTSRRVLTTEWLDGEKLSQSKASRCGAWALLAPRAPVSWV